MIETKSMKVFTIVNYFILAVLSFIFIYPLIHVLAASFSDPDEMRSYTGLLFWPRGFTDMGYKLVFKNPNILSGYQNTLFLVTVGTAINMIMTTMGAYVLSRRNLMIKKPLMIVITITMFFGGGMVPTFLVINSLGLTDTLWSLILPGAISTYNMIVMRTSFAALPAELEESAWLDGAGDLRILISILLPVSKAMLAVIALFYAVGHWNSWFSASIYLRHREKFPLQLILREIVINNDTTVNAQHLNSEALKAIDQNSYFFKELVKYSTIIVSIAPILCVYPFLQRFFVKGVMIGSLKG